MKLTRSLHVAFGKTQKTLVLKGHFQIVMRNSPRLPEGVVQNVITKTTLRPHFQLPLESYNINVRSADTCRSLSCGQ